MNTFGKNYTKNLYQIYFFDDINRDAPARYDLLTSKLITAEIAKKILLEKEGIVAKIQRIVTIKQENKNVNFN